jgi:CBS domain-containing protein
MVDPPETTLMALSTVSVRDVMSPGVIAIPSDSSVRTCARTMFERRTHAVLVVDSRSREPLGWVTHQDILRYLRSDPFTTLAGAAVRETPAYIEPDATVEQAAEMMVEENTTHLLVGAPELIPLGVLSSWDLVAHYAQPKLRYGGGGEIG